MNVVGKPYEGELHVRFDVAGAGKGQQSVTYQSSTLLNPSRCRVRLCVGRGLEGRRQTALGARCFT